MLEETLQAYSYPGHLYVLKRTHVWRPTCGPVFAPSVTFSQRRKTLWVPRCLSETKPIQRDVDGESIPSARTEAGWATHHPMSVLRRGW